MYDFSKLRGRIVEILGSNRKLAHELNISDRTLSLKLNNKVYFSPSDINEICEILRIEENEIGSYFFKKKVQ